MLSHYTGGYYLRSGEGERRHCDPVSGVVWACGGGVGVCEWCGVGVWEWCACVIHVLMY